MKNHTAESAGLIREIAQGPESPVDIGFPGRRTSAPSYAAMHW